VSSLVRVRDLAHVYDRRPVLSVPELDVPAGRWHVAGPNGAGKTTFLGILSTLIRPTRGEIAVAGHPLPEQARQARAHLGYVGHEPSLHPDLAAREALAMHAGFHEVPQARVDEALATWSLTERGSRSVAELSFGQRRRLDLARALLHEPEVLLLDEPARGLDEAGQATLADQLAGDGPELVLVGAPERAPVEVGGRIQLADGRVQEAPA
jgi:ABC-2 type transport system ATP-binding protein